jgi:cyclin-dependent kinase
VLGTPNEDTWPGVTSLPDWNEDFPVWPSLLLSRYAPGLSESGVDLLEVSPVPVP